MKTYKSPGGQIYKLFEDMLSRPHLLIAGATGTGKSVLINGLIHTALHFTPDRVQFILIDPKRVELKRYKNIPHCIKYASEPKEMLKALQQAIDIIERRFKYMRRRDLLQYDGPHVYVIIDELADLLTTQKREVEPILQRIGQIGRAAGVGLLAATQRPTSDIISPKIFSNMNCRVGLRTVRAQDSRNIIGCAGCECLPDPLTDHIAKAYYLHNARCDLYTIPYISDDERKRYIDYWTGRQIW